MDMEEVSPDQVRRSRQALEEAGSHPEDDEYDPDQEEQGEDGQEEGDTCVHDLIDLSQHPFHHHHHNKHRGHPHQEDQAPSPPPIYNGHVQEEGEEDDDDDDDDDDDEGEEGGGRAAGFPVPHPRPHQQGLTPLLGRRPQQPLTAAQEEEDQGGNNSSSSRQQQQQQQGGLEEAELPQYSPGTLQDQEQQEVQEEVQEVQEGVQEEGREEAEGAVQDMDAGSVASSGRKQSVDSLATTATVFRSGADRAPASNYSHATFIPEFISKGATTMRSLSLLYALLLVALGAVFPLAFFLSGRTREAGMCFALLHIYVTLTSIIFVIYLNIAIWRHKRHECLLAGDTGTDADEANQQEATPEEGGKPLPAEPEENGYLTPDGGDSQPSPAPRKQLPPGSASSPGGTLASTTTASPTPHDDRRDVTGSDVRTRTLEAGYGILRVPLVGHTEDGVNWFLRLGLIAFGMGSMVLDGFRLVQVVDADVSVQCIGLLFLVFTALRLLFTFAQTFFLFKNHRVVINFSPLLVRLTLLHLAATNIVTWVMTVIMEGANSYVNHRYTKGFPLTNPTDKFYTMVNGTADNGGNIMGNGTAAAEKSYVVVNGTDGVTSEPVFNQNVTSGAADPTGSRTLEWLFEDMPPIACYQKRSLATEASPFLFPFVIEYSLLAIAILCRMYVNVGSQPPLRDDLTEVKEPTEGSGKSRGTLECHKANSGLFIGLFVFTLVCIGMLFFLLFQNGVNPISEPLTALVYYGSDISVNIFSLIALAPAFAQMRKLHFSAFVQEVFNENLMYVSVTGFFAMVAFMVVPALISICAGGVLALLSELQAISCILSLIQACTQVVFIFDGLRRRAATRTHFRSKPGRSLITFLLLCNVSLWVIDTFELKEAMTAELFMGFYGDLPWMLLVHVVLPLTIFFRFHSTVCLSDMWVNAYHRPRFVPARPLRQTSPDPPTVYY